MPAGAGLVWEVDEFFGDNAGLVVAEIELQDEAQAFERPAWLGAEVTDDKRYLNSNFVGAALPPLGVGEPDGFGKLILRPPQVRGASRDRPARAQAGGPAHAQVPAVEKAATSLERVTVSGQHYDNAVGSSDAASQGVIRADLLKHRPALRPGEVLEFVPGLVVTQHSGDGKANQYFLRGFNLDHGTDFATTVNGLPVNMPTHGHGQGYADLNFLIPELVDRIDYRRPLTSRAMATLRPLARPTSPTAAAWRRTLPRSHSARISSAAAWLQVRPRWAVASRCWAPSSCRAMTAPGPRPSACASAMRC